MRYIFTNFEGIQKWIEVNDDGYALRQITDDSQSIINQRFRLQRLRTSCRDGYLDEGIIDTINNCKQISKSDFENIWHNATHELRLLWDANKQRYPIGEKVFGVVNYLYPQGSIFDLGNIQGCIAHSDIKTFRDMRRFPIREIHGIVKGYDEVNMWVLLHKGIYFFTEMEFEICKWLRDSEDEQYKEFWCDGVELSENEQHYSFRSVSKNRYVNLNAWISTAKNPGSESLYILRLNFGPKALSRFSRNLSILEYFSHVCVLDTEREFIELQLL